MANLNFQQPPRSIANSSIGRSTGGGFGGSSLSGHVTPTSGMFPTGKLDIEPKQKKRLVFKNNLFKASNYL